MKQNSILLKINHSFIMKKQYTVLNFKKNLKIQNVYNNQSINDGRLTLQPLLCTYGRPGQ